jgi:hypothetical protein
MWLKDTDNGEDVNIFKLSKYKYKHNYQHMYQIKNGRVVEVSCWDCGFESRRGHGCLCCVCCTVRTKRHSKDNQDTVVVQIKYREQKKPGGFTEDFFRELRQFHVPWGRLSL